MIILKLLISIVIGYVVGWERHRHNTSGGGSRTLALVSLASCLVAILSQKLLAVPYITFDFTRLCAYSLASIGFLTSGVIIKNEDNVIGLTTASTIWVMVPINFFIGFGDFVTGLLSAGLVYGILASKYWFRKDNHV